MHHCMPPSKTGWPSLHVVIFPPVMGLILDDPKTVTTPEIIDQIHELIFEDRRISAKSIAEQLGISRERLGPSFMKVWTWGSSPRSGSRNAWTRIKKSTVPVAWATFGIFSARSKLFPVRRDWWPWTKPGYITMTRRQSNNQWSGGIAAHPAPPQKIPSTKIRRKVLASFFGIKTASFSLSIFQSAQLSTRSIVHLCWCNWRTFRRKNAAGRSPRGPCSWMTMPRLTGHLQPRRNWPTWSSTVLITHPLIRVWPRRTTTCSLDWKNNWKVAIFRPTRRPFLPGRPGWTDKLLNFFFFLVALKVTATG